MVGLVTAGAGVFMIHVNQQESLTPMYAMLSCVIAPVEKGTPCFEQCQPSRFITRLLLLTPAFHTAVSRTESPPITAIPSK